MYERVSTPKRDRDALLTAATDLVATLDPSALSSSELIDLLGKFEHLKSACAAAQVRATAAFERLEHSPLARLDIAKPDRERSVAGQVALARTEGPSAARRRVAVAGVLSADMPNTLCSLAAGEISEWHATEIAGQTVALTAAERRELDAELAGKLRSTSVKQARRMARAIAQCLQPDTSAELTEAAERTRCVTIRPTDDGMAPLTARLPMVQGVSLYAKLHHAALSAKNSGDSRSRGQLMADLLVDRLCGHCPDSTAAGSMASPRFRR